MFLMRPEPDDFSIRIPITDYKGVEIKKINTINYYSSLFYNNYSWYCN